MRVRRDVVDLNVAKSTFFALTDASGVAIRNDLEEDVDGGTEPDGHLPRARERQGRCRDGTGHVPERDDEDRSRRGLDRGRAREARRRRDWARSS